MANLVSAGQALILIFLVGESASTDAFLAAYALYVPIALVGVSQRKSLVPLLGTVGSEPEFRRHASALISSVATVALAGAAVVALIAPLAPYVITRGLPDDAQRVAFLTLLVLAPAAYFQMHAGAASATLNAIRRFPASVTLYVGSGLVALGVSALLVTLIGVLGAAFGLLAGSALLAFSHTLYIRRLGIHGRPRGRLLRRPAQGRLALYLVAGVSLGASQQVALALALSAVSGEPGSITSYAYAYFIVGLILNVSATALSVIALPDLVEAVSLTGRSGARDQLVRVVPFMFAVLAPMLVAFALFGQPILDLAFGSALSQRSIQEIFEVALLLELMVIPASVFVVAGSVILALGRWRSALWVAAVSVAMHAVALYAVASGGPQAVAGAHAAAATAAMLLLMATAFGRGSVGVLAEIVRRAVPAFVLASVFVVASLFTGPEPAALALLGALLVAAAAYASLVVLVWPRVGSAFLRAFGADRGTRRKVRRRQR